MINVFIIIIQVYVCIWPVSWLHENMAFAFSFVSFVKFFQLFFYRTTLYLQVVEWMSIAFVMRFESKVAVKTMMFKNYDGTTNRFVKKEYALRNVLIAFYVFYILSGTGLYLYNTTMTDLFNVGKINI